MTEQMPTINKRIAIPKTRRKGRLRVPATVRKAADEYKAAYSRMYGVPAGLTWDGVWIRIAGQPEGVSTRRLREMTTQLKRRIG